MSREVFRRVRRRFRALFRNPEVELELTAELRYHLERQVDQYTAAGMSPEQARLRARREFGGIAQVEEDCRDQRRVRWIETIVQDVRFGLRMLRRNPAFTSAAAATLALAIGVNTALLSIANAVLVRPLPYRDANRLVMIFQTPPRHPDQLTPATPNDFIDWRDHAHSLSGLGALLEESYTWTGAGDAVRLNGAQISTRFLEVAGVGPVLGRTFLPEEEQPARKFVVMLGNRLWKNRFGGAPGVIGRTLNLDGKPHTVIGVLPEEFFPNDLDVLSPFPLDQHFDRHAHFLGTVIGRLAPGVDIGQAQAEMNLIASRLGNQYPDTNREWGARIVPLREQIAGPFRPALLILVGAAALVLLIACANVANLMLARGSLRQREMAIRASLGAGRARLVRQLLIEGALLSAGAGALALIVAQATQAALIALLPPLILVRLPFVRDLSLHPATVAITLGVSLVIVALAGLVPALEGSRTGLAVRRFARSHRLRSVLVVAEAALAVVLVVGGGLAMRSLARVLDVHPGFEPSHLLSLNVMLPPPGYTKPAQIVARERDILRRAHAIPGVQSAATVLELPLSSAHQSTFGIEGHSFPGWTKASCEYYGTSTAYFETIGAPLVRGRRFVETDSPEAPKVAIINETLARNFFANEDPIGKKLTVFRASPEKREIVGIVGDMHQMGLDRVVAPTVYLPSEQDPPIDMLTFGMVLRTGPDPRSLTSAVRTAIGESDRDMVLYDIRPMTEVITASPSLALRRVPSLLVLALAVLAVVLAGVGFAGVLAGTVNRQAQEIGIRMALGADPAGVAWGVLSHSLKLMGLGLAIGIAASLALSSVVRTWVFGIAATDVVTYLAAPLLLVLVAILAAWIPARRASRIDPAIALRCD